MYLDNEKLAESWKAYLRGAGIEYVMIFDANYRALIGFELPEFKAVAMVKKAFSEHDIEQLRGFARSHKRSYLLLGGEPSVRTYTHISQSGDVANVVLARYNDEVGRLWYDSGEKLDQNNLEDYPKDTGRIVARGLRAVQKWREAAEAVEHTSEPLVGIQLALEKQNELLKSLLSVITDLAERWKA
jgi:hypothetical protein